LQEVNQDAWAMRPERKTIAVLALLGVMLGNGAARAAEPVAGLAPQSSSAAGVTVKITPRNLSARAAAWEFEVVFDTHSQDLSDDPLKSASLITNGGARIAPQGWQGDPAGGHHRKGVLSFKPPAAPAAQIELQLQRPGEAVPRVFRWQLK
jgi:hypothetical protein